MPTIESRDVNVPLTVPEDMGSFYIENYLKLTHNTGKMFLFAGDQRVEHLNTSFYGEGISKEDNNPKHYFEIAKKSPISALATQLGFISKYGGDYNSVPYVVKLNSITRLLKNAYGYKHSKGWYSPEDIAEFKNRTNLNIYGVGYTLYLGIEQEPSMLKEAAQVVKKTHEAGLVSILWVYPKGPEVKDQKDVGVLSHAASVGASVGADFIKLNPPKIDKGNSKDFERILSAAGRSKVVFAGGSNKNKEKYINQVKYLMSSTRCSGVAVGRNLHQKNLSEAVELSESISQVIFSNSNRDKEEIRSLI